MRVTIKSGVHGARHAQGLAVLVDVFRGSSTITTAFARGAKYVIPVVSLSEARKLRRTNPDYLLVGETKGKAPNDFDCGNSPFEISLLNLKDRIVVFRSSAASKAIFELQDHAKISELLIGSFLNARSIAKYVKVASPEEVTLIAVGTIGFGPWRKAVEDEVCAKYIKNLLEEKEVDFAKLKNEILRGEGAARLLRLDQAKDLEFCLKLNLFDGIVPRMLKNDEKICVVPFS